MTQEFSVSVEDFAKKTKGKLGQFIIRLSQEIFKTVVIRTPVDTGFLRANWFVTLNEAAAGQRVAAPGNADSATAAALLNIGATLALADPSTLKAVYILNNTEYARFIEYGTSTIEPRAMVRGTLAEARSIAEKIARQMAGE